MEPPPFGDGNVPNHGARPPGLLAASMEPPPFGDGNLLPVGLPRLVVGASMEPPPFGDGNWDTPRTARLVCTKLQWSHRLSAMETAQVMARIGEDLELQWSHRLSAMETGLLLGPAGGLLVASMEPPPFGDGSCLNVDGTAVVGDASMEPPPFGDGNHRVAGRFRRFNRLASMEPPPFGDGNCGLPLNGFGAGDASMEPPPFGDGNVPTCSAPPFTSPRFNGATAFRRWKPGQHRPALQDQNRASMEPPPFGDGNYKLGTDWSELWMLQWSHRLSAMETGLPSAITLSCASLQWSHRLSAMETAIRGWLPSCFNVKVRISTRND